MKLKSWIWLTIYRKKRENNREELWRIRNLKEAAHMLSYSNLLGKPNLEMNTICEPTIRKINFFKIAI